MGWLDGITDSMDISLSEQDLATEQLDNRAWMTGSVAGEGGGEGAALRACAPLARAAHPQPPLLQPVAFSEKRFLPGAPADPEPECPLLGRHSPRPPGGLSRGWVSRPWSLGCGTKNASKEGAGKLDLIEMKDFCALKDIPEDKRSVNHTPGEGPTPTCVENADNPTAESQPSRNRERT